MTEKNPAIFIQAGTHPAEDVRRAFDIFVGAGSEGIVAATDLAVTETGTPAMSVTVATGRAIIQGTEGTYQGPYIVENRGITVVAVTASDVSNPRTDLVVARVQDQAYSGTTNAWSLAVIEGTPAASPVAPTLPANALLLATVTVAAAVSTIVNANIADGRVIHPAPYYPGDTVPVSDGGTGATTAGAARTALGAADATTVFNLGSDVSSNWARLNGIDTVQATQTTDIGTNTTKLSGIEAGADVTDFTNVMAAGALDKTIIPTEIMTAASDEITAVVTAVGVMQFRMPYAMTGSSIRASLGSACATGTFTLDVLVGAATVFSTLLTVDATEKTSTTAAIPAVLSVTAWPDDSAVSISVTGQGDGTATGLKITMIGTRSA